MKKHHDFTDLLLKSFDTALDSKESEILENALDQSSDLKNEKELYLQMRTLIQDQSFTFSPFFVSKVIHEIQRQLEDDWLVGWRWVFRKIALPALAVVMIALGFIWITEQQISLDTISGVDNIPVNDLMAQFLVQL